MSEPTREELLKQIAELERKLEATQSGSGSIAQGEQAQAAGARGVVAGQAENILTGDGARVVKTTTYVENQTLNQLLDPDRTDPQSLTRAYLSHLCGETGFLSLSGVDPKAMDEQSDSRLELAAVYTALLTHRTERHDADALVQASGRLNPENSEPRHLSAVEMLNASRHLVLLGDPGGGKSTFVNFVALCLAGELLQVPEVTGANLALLTTPLPPDDAARKGDKEAEPTPQPWDHGALLPVRVVLRDFAAQGLPPAGQTATADHLWDFIAAQLNGASLPEFASILKKRLLEEGGLILLDGLDEVPDAETRRIQIKDAVTDFKETYSNCRLLVTSRIYAYQKQAWRLPGFDDVTLAPFSNGQIRTFVERWYTHYAFKRQQDPQDAQGRAELLKHAIFASDRLAGFAERPLLLTLMASLHAWRGGNLPERREELYSEAVSLLRDRWESQRVVRNAQGQLIIIQPSLVEWLKVTDRDAIQALLNRLAFEAHQDQPELVGTADIPQEKLVAGLLAIGDNPDVRPQRLIEYLSNRAGLLLPRGNGVYTFPHRTFQEYLAAWHLTDDEFSTKLAGLARQAPTRWREPTLLAGAKAARGAASTIWSLVDELSFREPNDPAWSSEDDWGAHLAAQALVETANSTAIRNSQISGANQRKVATVKAGLCHILAHSCLPATERALVGQNLARLGDPRREVLDVNQMRFCYVPPSPFEMGDGRERHSNDVDYGYWIGRFPVTNTHYAQFVRTAGYAHADYWPEAAAAEFWRNGQFKGRYEREFRTGPQTFGNPFNLPNHPAVGVSWYEALAFCRWLTEHLQEKEQLAEGWRVTLPNEPEWEKAARGGRHIVSEPIVAAFDELRFVETVLQLTQLISNPLPQRAYPWGDDEDPERSNYNVTDINSTSAVGCFASGRSPYGAQEMAGNVWEWTRSLHGDYPYPQAATAQRQRENLAADADAGRVLRGGSFANNHNFVRCAARYHDLPNNHNVLIGFRCVVSTFFSAR